MAGLSPAVGQFRAQGGEVDGLVLHFLGAQGGEATKIGQLLLHLGRQGEASSQLCNAASAGGEGVDLVLLSRQPLLLEAPKPLVRLARLTLGLPQPQHQAKTQDARTDGRPPPLLSASGLHRRPRIADGSQPGLALEQARPGPLGAQHRPREAVGLDEGQVGRAVRSRRGEQAGPRAQRLHEEGLPQGGIFNFSGRQFSVQRGGQRLGRSGCPTSGLQQPPSGRPLRRHHVDPGLHRFRPGPLSHGIKRGHRPALQQQATPLNALDHLALQGNGPPGRIVLESNPVVRGRPRMLEGMTDGRPSQGDGRRLAPVELEEHGCPGQMVRFGLLIGPFLKGHHRQLLHGRHGQCLAFWRHPLLGGHPRQTEEEGPRLLPLALLEAGLSERQPPADPLLGEPGALLGKPDGLGKGHIRMKGVLPIEVDPCSARGQQGGGTGVPVRFELMLGRFQEVQRRRIQANRAEGVRLGQPSFDGDIGRRQGHPTAQEEGAQRMAKHIPSYSRPGSGWA